MTINGHEFEVRVEPIEVTMSGLFGGKPDNHRVFIPGLRQYFVDGRSVTEEEFRQLLEANTSEDWAPEAV